jgi:hypothetical protein
MALHTVDLAVAGSAAAVTDTATVGGAVAVADPATATFDRPALGVLLADFFSAVAVCAMADASLNRFHATDSTKSGQSELVL